MLIAIILIIIGVLALGGGVWYVKEKKRMEKTKKQAEELVQNYQKQNQEVNQQSVTDDETTGKLIGMKNTDLSLSILSNLILV